MRICGHCRNPTDDVERCPRHGCRGRTFEVAALAGLRVDHPVGNGSFGSVFACTAADGAGRAVKLIDLRTAQKRGVAVEDLREGFTREWRTLERLDHRHVIRCHGWGEADDLLFLILDFLPTTLDKLRSRSQAVGLARATQLGADLADALAYCHAKDVVHRDVKPGNVGLDSMDRAVLFDFGARLVRPVTLSPPKTLSFWARRWPGRRGPRPIGPPSGLARVITAEFRRTGCPRVGFAAHWCAGAASAQGGGGFEGAGGGVSRRRALSGARPTPRARRATGRRAAGRGRRSGRRRRRR